MPSSGMFRRVALVRTDDSQECVTSVLRIERISELRITLVLTSNVTATATADITQKRHSHYISLFMLVCY
jgi:hypothetical protein